MKCRRCIGGTLFAENDDYGRTVLECWNCGRAETIGFIPITDDPNYRDHVREGGIKKRPSPHMTTKTIEEQERAYQMRMAQNRIQQQKQRLKRQGIA